MNDDDTPYLYGLTFSLYKAAADYLLTQEFGGRLVTNQDGRYSPEQVRRAAEVIRTEEGSK